MAQSTLRAREVRARRDRVVAVGTAIRSRRGWRGCAARSPAADDSPGPASSATTARCRRPRTAWPRAARCCPASARRIRTSAWRGRPMPRRARVQRPAHHAVDDDRQDRARRGSLCAAAEQRAGRVRHALRRCLQFGRTGGQPDGPTQHEALPGRRGEQVGVLEHAERLRRGSTRPACAAARIRACPSARSRRSDPR